MLKRLWWSSDKSNSDFNVPKPGAIRPLSREIEEPEREKSPLHGRTGKTSPWITAPSGDVGWKRSRGSSAGKVRDYYPCQARPLIKGPARLRLLCLNALASLRIGFPL